MTLLKIDLISDAICPWCMVGRRRLSRALTALRAAHPTLEVQLSWKPFMLAPDLPAAGINKLSHYNAKFGAARVAAMLPVMQEVGLKEGISFSYGGLIANTLDTHRLLAWALAEGGPSVQDDIAARLMHFYFEKEGNLGDRSALVAAAGAAGLNPEAAAAMLASSALVAEVQAEARELRQEYGVTGVPFFVLQDGAAVIEGAQDPLEMQRTIEKVLSM